MYVFKLADLTLNLLNTTLVARPLASVFGECERKNSPFRPSKQGARRRLIICYDYTITRSISHEAFVHIARSVMNLRHGLETNSS
jgi:hypothetical protein